MKNKSMKNFHLPLPEDLYGDLRAEAERSSVTATTLARQALEEWLRQKRRSHLRRAIEVYAAEAAGSTDDLDEGLESAAVARLMIDEESA